MKEEEIPGGGGLLWCPAMFMYSKADPLIPHRHVEAFASARAMRIGHVAAAMTQGEGVGGGVVVMKRWDDAPHCEIGRMDPEGYRKALKDFLKPARDTSDSTTAGANDVKPWDKD